MSPDTLLAPTWSILRHHPAGNASRKREKGRTAALQLHMRIEHIGCIVVMLVQKNGNFDAGFGLERHGSARRLAVGGRLAPRGAEMMGGKVGGW